MRISDWSSYVCSSDLCPAWEQNIQNVSASLIPVSESQVPATHNRQSGRHCYAVLRSQKPLAVRPAFRGDWPPRSDSPRNRYERSEEHTSELQSLMRISYAVFCLKKKTQENQYSNDNIKQVKITHNHFTTHSTSHHRNIY